MRALEMYFRILRSKGMKAQDAYTVSRYAISHSMTLSIALMMHSYSQDILKTKATS